MFTTIDDENGGEINVLSFGNDAQAEAIVAIVDATPK